MRYTCGRLLVWDETGKVGCTDPHIIRNVTLTTQSYADEILRLYIVPYIEAIDDSFLLMLDNRLYTTRLLENMLKVETIYQTCSPNLNPIKYLWNSFELCIGATQITPLTVQDFKIAILEE